MKNNTLLFLCYIKMELKRSLYYIPKLVVGQILLLAVVAVISLSATNLLYGENENNKITIAISVEDSDKTAIWMLNIIKEMESIKEVCQFVDTDEQSAYEMLNDGQAYGAILIPKGFVGGILNGENKPAKIILSNHSPIEKALISELANSGSVTLSSAQAGIYAISDFAIDMNRRDVIQNIEQELNMEYIKFILHREKYFSHVEKGATGLLTTKEYYIASGVVLFLMLNVLSLGKLLKNEGKAFHSKLTIFGVSNWKVICAKTICCFVVILMTALIALLILFFTDKIYDWDIVRLYWWLIPILFCIILLSASFGVCIFTVSKSQFSGTLFVFIITIVMVFISGGLIPIVFLPENIAALSAFMPTYYMINAVGGILSGNIIWSSILICVAWSLLFYLISVLIMRAKEGSVFIRKERRR